MNRESGKQSIENTRVSVGEIKETAEKITSEGKAIDDILKGYSYDGLDSDDIASFKSGVEGYSKDFEAERQSQIDNPSNEAISGSNKDINELNEGKSSVNEGINAANKATAISDIGSGNSEQISSQFENSKNEYENLISENQNLI